MFDRLRALVLRALRVPPEPTLPAGARVIRVFRAAPNYYRYRVALWVAEQVVALAAVAGALFVVSEALRTATDPTAVLLLRIAGLGAVAIYLLQLGFRYALLRLDFEMRWYILMDRSLRIREGVLSVREKTMTFANIQQISIRRNPLQRALGLADVHVRTAGGGASAQGRGGHPQVGESGHEAYFRGVDNAEEIRAAIRERVRIHKDAGLGDPDEPAPANQPPPSAWADALSAAREVRNEIRSLSGRGLHA